MSFTPDHTQWLQRRGIDPDLARSYGLRSELIRQGGQLRYGIAIPYRRHDKDVTTKVRWIDCGDPTWTHPGGGKILWNQDALVVDPQSPLIITEGEWDALTAISAGFARAVSVPCGASGKFDFSEEVRLAIRDTKKIILCGDNDDPGMAMNVELLRRFGAARCYRIIYPDGCKDLNEVLQLGGADAVRDVLEHCEPYPIKGLYSLSDYADVERQQVWSTGWRNLDPHFKLWRGEFCIITGIPSHGKSRFALELIASLNRNHQHRAVIASFEMQIVPHVRDIFREHYCNKRRADLTEHDKVIADVWLEEAIHFIDQDPRADTEEASLEWIIERAEDAVFRHSVDWLLIDPWNQIEHRRGRYENELDYQQRAIRALKRFARSYNCGVLLVVHPTKAVVDKAGHIRKPGLYDVSGSAHWYNAADHGLIIWRESMTDNKLLVTCAKSRYREAGLPGSACLELTDGRLQIGADTYSGFNTFS